MTKAKTISITLEQVLHTQAMPGGSEKELPTKYEIVSITNALYITVDGKRQPALGLMLSEKETESLASCKAYQVRITK